MNRISRRLVCAFFSLLLFCSGHVLAQGTNAPPACGPVMKINSAKALFDVTGRLKWDYSGPYSARGSETSTDVEVTGPLTFNAKDLHVPASCLKRDDCRRSAVMVIAKGLKGVVCTETENFLGVDHCVSVRLTGTTFRLRGKMMDTHPWKWNFVPVLEFLAPCGEPCKPGEFRCARDNTCRAGFNGYCRNCLEIPVEKCACLNEKGPLPDGTRCTFFISGDVICAGACRKGECVTPGGPSGNCGPCCR